MRVRFWGTRGSIATPGPDTNFFGGNTSCVELTTANGDLLIFDCGTGARRLAAELMAQGKKAINSNILLGHTHWDHIQGFPFFSPAFVKGNSVAIYGPEGSRGSLHDVLAGQMEFTYFPIELNQLPAAITYHDLTEGIHTIGGARVATQFLNHPAMTVGYRVEADGVAVVYLVDHEPFSDELWRAGAELGPHRVYPARGRPPACQIHGRRRPRDPRRPVHARGVRPKENLGAQHVRLRGANCRGGRRAAGRTDPPRSEPQRPLRRGHRAQGPHPGLATQDGTRCLLRV